MTEEKNWYVPPRDRMKAVLDRAQEAMAASKPICGWCADGLCEDHERDCAFQDAFPCECPNADLL